MEAQTSLEFLIILSTIAALSLSTIAFYAKNINTQKNILYALWPSSQNTSNTEPMHVSDKPEVAAVMQIQTTLGKPAEAQIIFYGCPSGSASITATSQSLLFSQNTTDISVNGFAIATFTFIPISTGTNKASLSYVLYCNGNRSTGSFLLNTYSKPEQSANLTQLYYASISNAKENIEYSTGNKEPIIYTTETTHCTYTDFNYNPYPIGVQCGTTNAWEYRVFSIWCYYNVGGTDTKTTCIYPHNTQYATASINSDAMSYAYNFTLKIGTPVGTLTSNISSAENTSPLMLFGRQVGYVTVANVSSENVPLQGGLLFYNNTSRIINESAYSQYEQASSNLYSVLAYYNSTLSYSQQIDQAIYAYNKIANQIINTTDSKPATGACAVNSTIENTTIICKAAYPFSYIITAHVANALGIGNETLSYMGSTITLSTMK